MALDLMTLGFGMETKGLERGQRALNDLERQGKKTADALDDTGRRGSAALGGVAKSATSAAAASQNAFASMVSGASGATSAFARLQAAALPALAAAFSGAQIVQAADAYTKYTAQLRLATASQQQYNEALATVQRISAVAQSDTSAITALYTRIANTTKDAGVSLDQVARITETVSLGLKASGASAGEASSAMLQLSQAFASGVLRGEEFNAVSEAAFPLMKALADSMGIPVDELRKLASEGRITRDELVKAFTDPALLSALRIKAKEVTTIGGAFTVLKGKIIDAVGAFDKATGSGKSVSEGINAAAKSIESFALSIPGLVQDISSLSKQLAPYIAGGAIALGLGALPGLIGAASVAITTRLIPALIALQASVPPLLALAGATATIGFVINRINGKKAKLQDLESAQKTIETIQKQIAQTEQIIAGGNSSTVTSERLKRLNIDLAQAKKAVLGFQDQASEKEWMASAEALLDSYTEKLGRPKGVAGASKDAEDAAKKLANAQKSAVENLKEYVRELEASKDKGEKLTKSEQMRLDLMRLFNGTLSDGVQIMLEKAAADEKAIALNDALNDSIKDGLKAQEKAIDQAKKEVESLKESNERLEMEIAGIGLKSEALAALEAQALETAAAQERMNATSLFADNNNELGNAALARAEELERKAGLIRKKGAKQAAQDQYEELKKAQEKSADDFYNLFTQIASKTGGSIGKNLLNALQVELQRRAIKIVVDYTFGQSGSTPGATGQGGLLESLINPRTNAQIGTAFTSAASGFALSGAGQSLGLSTPAAFSALDGAAAEFTAAGTAFTTAAGYIGKAAPYFGAINEAISGDPRKAAVQAAGVYFGGPLGGAIAGAVADKIFKTKISASAISQETLAPISDAVQTGFASILTQLGGTGSISASVRGNTGRQGQNANFTLMAGGYASWQRFGGDGLFGAGEIALNDANIAQEVTRAIFAGLRSSDFADNIDALFDSIDPVAASIEQLTQALEAAKQIDALNDAFKTLAFEGLRNLSGASLDVLQSFFTAIGGMEGLSARLASFNDKFLTDGEKQANLLKQVTEGFTALGVAMPSTRDEFKALVQTFSITDAATARTYAGLLSMTDAVDALYPATQQVKEATEDLSRVLSERESLEVRLLQAQGNTVALRERELSALDASNRGLLKQIFALEDAKQLQEEFARRVEESQDRVSSAQQNVVSAYQAAASAFEQIAQRARQAEDVLRQAYGRESGELQSTIDKFRTFARSLREFRQSLTIQNATGSNSIRLAQDSFREVARRALSGDQGAIADLQGVSENYLDAFKRYSTNFAQYAGAFAEVQSILAQTETAANAQADVAQLQLDALTESVSQQINLNDSVISVREAIEQLSTARDDTVNASAQISALKSVLNSFGVSVTDLGATLGNSFSNLGNQFRSTLNELNSALSEYGIALADNTKAQEQQKENDINSAVSAFVNSSTQYGRGDAIDRLQSLGLNNAQIAQRANDQIGGFAFDQTAVDFLDQFSSAGFKFDANRYAANVFSYLKSQAYENPGFAAQFNTPQDVIDYWATVEGNTPLSHYQKNKALIDSLGILPYANGGAFTNGIVQTPTFFNNSVMGEAGPEAIMPLSNIGGSLGVRAVMPNMDGMISELRMLRQEVAQLKSEQRVGLSTIAQGTTKTANLLDDVTQGAERFITVVEPM